MKETLTIDCPNCPSGHISWQEYANCLVADSTEPTDTQLGKDLVEALREVLKFEKGKKKLKTTKVVKKKGKKK